MFYRWGSATVVELCEMPEIEMSEIESFGIKRTRKVLVLNLCE
jgi:DNA-directed RNA polymerase alpha subunit